MSELSEAWEENAAAWIAWARAFGHDVIERLREPELAEAGFNGEHGSAGAGFRCSCT